MKPNYEAIEQAVLYAFKGEPVFNFIEEDTEMLTIIRESEAIAEALYIHLLGIA